MHKPCFPGRCTSSQQQHSSQQGPGTLLRHPPAQHQPLQPPLSTRRRALCHLAVLGDQLLAPMYPRGCAHQHLPPRSILPCVPGERGLAWLEAHSSLPALPGLQQGMLGGEVGLPLKGIARSRAPAIRRAWEAAKHSLEWWRALLLVVVSIYSDELEKFMESQGAANPGILILTTSLSKPFLRLDKYVTLLQELERHMEVGGMWDCWAGCAP